jgi:hypothetical protein
MHNLGRVREDLRAETITITGADGAELEAYLASPLDDQPHAGVVVIHRGQACPGSYVSRELGVALVNQLAAVAVHLARAAADAADD